MIGPATAPTVTPGSVVFSAEEFLDSYPQFTQVSPAALQGNFSLACLLLDNSSASVVQDAPTRQYLLYLLTCHISALLNGVDGEPPAGTVGRISDATQGSVSVRAEWASSVSNSEAFYIQTQWGAMAWQMMAQYRTARYVPPDCGMGEFSGFDAWPQ